MPRFEDLTPQERRALVEKSIRENTGDPATPGSSRNPYLPEFNMDITPPKPDPEADAELAIRASIEKARANSINPETGMPFYSPPQPISPEEAKRREEMQMKAEFLRRRSQGQ